MRLALGLLLLLVPASVLAQPGYGAPPPPVYTQAPVNHRQGFTFEANIGVGFMWATVEDDESDKKVALGGIDVGLGGWINERMAITARIAGVTYTESEGDIDLRWTTGFAGPSLQYWLDDHVWLGGGAGFGVVALSIDGPGGDDSDSEVGFGLDLRAGYTFSSMATQNTWNLSLELTPSFITVD